MPPKFLNYLDEQQSEQQQQQQQKNQRIVNQIKFQKQKQCLRTCRSGFASRKQYFKEISLNARTIGTPTRGSVRRQSSEDDCKQPKITTYPRFRFTKLLACLVLASLSLTTLSRCDLNRAADELPGGGSFGADIELTRHRAPATLLSSNTNDEDDASSSSSSSSHDLIEAMASSARSARQTGDSSTSSTLFNPLEDPSEDANLLSQPFDYHANMPVITKRELANAIKQASASVRKLRDSTEVSMVNNQLVMEVGSTSWLANSMFHKATLDMQVLNQTNQALMSEEATRLLAKQYKLNRIQTLKGLPLISVDQTNLGKQCQRSSRNFNCIAGRYRSLSGHCNNVQNPHWGSAQSPLLRYAPARYSDYVARPIKSAKSSAQQTNNQQALPSSRAVSMAIYGSSITTHQPIGNSNGTTDNDEQLATNGQHSHMTTMMSFFGQFIFHDLAFISQYTGFEGALIKCCGLQAINQHPECLPIELKDSRNDYCLDYVRSSPAIRSGCNLGPRDQINLVSSYLDGSAIYGSNEEQTQRLRAFVGGRLRSQRVPINGPASVGQQINVGRQTTLNQGYLELLPQIFKLLPIADANSSNSLDTIWSAAAEDCRQMAIMKRKTPLTATTTTTNDADYSTNVANQQSRCFQAGDSRVNENIGLTLMHTIWMREHNHIADKLAQINKHWRDERLFEETRRIVIAELQHITYNEFLPSIIGDELMQRFNLSILSQGYSQNYDPLLNAGVSNELATAVFPFILSTIPSTLERYSDRLEMLGTTNVADTFMDGSDLFKRNRFAQYLMGMISQNAMEPALGVMPMTMDMAAAAAAASSSNAPPSSAQLRAIGGGQRARRQSDSASIALVDGASISENGKSPPQVDIVALTIQQARDHGLQSYLYWRQVCQLKPIIKSWSDLVQVMPASVVNRLQQVYSSVDQIDLYLALLESPLSGATVGPTFVCLLARQFFHLKHGDRYWFENDLPGSSFSPKQLEQIRQSSLAKVMCRNSQATINFIQPAPMITSDPYLNAYQYCTNKAMVNLDLSKWQQAVTSAQQLNDELITGGGNFGDQLGPSLERAKRLVETNARLITQSLHRAKRQLDEVAHREMVQLRRFKRSTTTSKHHRSSSSSSSSSEPSSHAGYRYLPRMKRNALKINNQSLIFELATNELIRSMIHQGKDREQAQSIQSDIREFLHSLEGIQLDNLLDNSDGSARLQEFISGAGGNFLTQEQRIRLAQSGDTSLTADPLLDSTNEQSAIGRTSSVSANCQDDDKAYPCDHTTPFRTITGWCNNLNQPKFGQSFTTLDRILTNAYEDGLSKPRQSSVVLASQQTGERLPLPSARLISTTMHDDKSQLHARYSLALMQFGQFGVDHDLTRTPFSVALDGSLLDCSPCDSKRTVHRDCLPIEIPDNDAHFQSHKARDATGTGKKCLHFVRSLNGQTGLGPRQQINALTAYLDGSNIYGSDNCEAKSLRAFVGGRLNSSAYPTLSSGAAAASSSSSQQVKLKEILPVTRANPECVTPNGICFHAGDQRASEQPGLTSIHTIFMRLHNSIVGQLSAVNRHWNDERLYQHGRRIVAAIMQRITYNEFAPRLLGLDYMSKFDLMLKNVGYSDHYDETCSASILNEFAAAAFRMGHSLIRSAFPLLNKQYKPIGKSFQLRKAFFNSQRILNERKF